MFKAEGVEIVDGVTMEATTVGSAAMGVVQSRQRCRVLHKARESSLSTTCSSDFDAMLESVRSRRSADRGLYMWVDLEGCTDEQSMTMLNELFPDMQPSQVELVLAPHAYDAVELEPVRGSYLVGSLACACTQRRCASEEDDENVVPCNFACSDQTLLTVHAAPFVGLAELLRYVKVEGCLDSHRDKNTSVLSRAMGVRTQRAAAGEGPSLTSSTILSLLICFTCEAFLPDPTSLLSEVGNIDEMVLLISPGEQDQTDLLRRVALLRCRISSFRTGLYLKERLLQDLIVPTMRLSFVAKNADTVKTYKETLEKVRQVSERLDDTRDMLNQANLNFITGVSMRMGQASAGLDFKLNVLNQVAAICLPVNLILSIFGMNCKVPYISDQNDTLVPFAVIVGFCVVWTSIFLIPLIRKFIQGPKADPMAPCE